MDNIPASELAQPVQSTQPVQPVQPVTPITPVTPPVSTPIKPIFNEPEPPTNVVEPGPPKVVEPGFSQEIIQPLPWKGVLKLVYLVIFTCAAVTATIYLNRWIAKQGPSNLAGDILLEAHYQPVLWQDFGEVFEPIVKIPVYYPSSGYEDKEFLLDSGALVSSLPREEAKKMGLALSQLQRSTFAGFGGMTSFAYKGSVKIKLKESEINLPVVFTEAAGTKPILGRSGFFENYSIYFNSKAEKIEIRK